MLRGTAMQSAFHHVRFSYSLKTLMRVTAIAAILLGTCSIAIRWHLTNIHEHRGQVAISALGGTFSMASAGHFKKYGQMPNWFHRKLLNYVSHVDLSFNAWPRTQQAFRPITDSDLVVLEDFSKLRSLDLRGTSLTDECVKHIKQLRHLEELNITQTQISEIGASELSSALPRCNIVR
jgi:hypothetical protein